MDFHVGCRHFVGEWPLAARFPFQWAECSQKGGQLPASASAAKSCFAFPGKSAFNDSSGSGQKFQFSWSNSVWLWRTLLYPDVLVGPSPWSVLTFDLLPCPAQCVSCPNNISTRCSPISDFGTWSVGGGHRLHQHSTVRNQKYVHVTFSACFSPWNHSNFRRVKISCNWCLDRRGFTGRWCIWAAYLNTRRTEW